MSTSAIILPADDQITLASSRRQITEADARHLTAEIQRASVRLWVLVTEAHDRKAHAALGYDTWDAYVRAELRMSPSRSYQLLDTGHVMRELAVAGADLEATAIPPARVVARVKDQLPELRRVVRKAIRDGEDVDASLRALARQVRPRPAVPAQGGAPEVEVIVRAGRPPTMVVCPACSGEGKVSRTLSTKLQAWMKKNR